MVEAHNDAYSSAFVWPPPLLSKYGYLRLLTLLSKYVWESIAQENYLCNVGPERADTFSQENNLILICLYQHCKRKLPSQRWPTAQRTTLHRKIISNDVLINVGQYCARTLPVQCWSMVNKELFLAKYSNLP